MKIGPVEFDVEPLKASLYMRASRCGCDASLLAFAFLGFAMKAPPIPKPSHRDGVAVEAFGEAVFDHFIDAGASFEDVSKGAAEVVNDVSARLGFTKREVEADADFSLATGDGS